MSTYNKDQWMSSFQDQMVILRPHLTLRVLGTLALQAWHKHGTTDPIKAARLVMGEMTGTRPTALKRRR